MSEPAVTSKSGKLAVFRARLLSTLIMWAAVVGVFVSGQPLAFIALLSVLALVSLAELLSMSGRYVPKVSKWITAAISVICGALLAVQMHGGGDAEAILIVSAAVLLFATFAVAMRRAPEGVETLLEALLPLLAFALIVVMFFASSLALLFHVPGEGAVPGAWLMLYCVMVTKFSDMGAYVTGVSFGKKKMIPHISPGKTWAGLAGGLAVPVVTSVIFYISMPDSLGAIPSVIDAVVLGLGLGGIAVIGDLAASLVKRCLACKDSGAFLPGIGGIFDLIDSICFSAPFLWGYLLLRGAL